MSHCFCTSSTNHFKSYADVNKHLESIGLFHMDLSLDRMEKALHALGVQKMPCPLVQVVGTNGKGSTSTFLTSLALAHGFNTGLFTSPHFLHPNERIRMNNKPLPEMVWADLASQVYCAAPDLTYFEMLTSIALMAFQISSPDILIFEAGLGGRYDATSAIFTDLLCITPISLDHQDILGETLQEIASDKANAMKKSLFAVLTAPQEAEVIQCLKKEAKNEGLPFYSIQNTGLVEYSDFSKTPESSNSSDFSEGAEASQHSKISANAEVLRHNKLLESARLPENIELSLYGLHQIENAQTALLAWHLLCKKQGWTVDKNAIKKGLSNAFLSGRFQSVKAKKNLPSILLDGAHNVAGMQSLAQSLESLDQAVGTIIFSCLKNKNPQKLVAILEKMSAGANIIVTSIKDNDRALSCEELAEYFSIHVQKSESLELALDQVKGEKELLLICGSLYLLGEYYTIYPEDLL